MPMMRQGFVIGTASKMRLLISTQTTISQGQSVPEVIQWIVVQLRTVMACQDIAMYTDLSEL